jgi:ubiquinone/menaquinone biosynthesis C-methylase UbiE
MSEEKEYVLGTHDEEIARLGLQHRVWRPRALNAWMRAGFTTGQTLVDAGCGPGWATIDLAEITGPSGRVIAIDKSPRFLSALQSNAASRQLTNIDVVNADLEDDALPEVQADGIWVRWVFAFVRRPQELLAKITRMLRPGGTIVVHEYFDYSTWRMAPRSEIFEQYVAAVMASWRDNGGEPDVGLDLPRWMSELGLRVTRRHPIIDVISPSSFIWEWPRAFVEVGLARLVDLGRMTADQAKRVRDDFTIREAAAHTMMINPAVIEIVAVAP